MKHLSGKMFAISMFTLARFILEMDNPSRPIIRLVVNASIIIINTGRTTRLTVSSSNSSSRIYFGRINCLDRYVLCLCGHILYPIARRPLALCNEELAIFFFCISVV